MILLPPLQIDSMEDEIGFVHTSGPFKLTACLSSRELGSFCLPN